MNEWKIGDVKVLRVVESEMSWDGTFVIPNATAENLKKERDWLYPTFSDETGALLDTGGGIAKALPFFENRPFLTHNSDSLWIEGMVAGKGWIALALTTFATWRPARVLLGAYLFGGVTMLELFLQNQGVEVASQFLSMLPYLATIVVLVLISRNATFIRVNMPASIGKPFFPGS